MVCATLCIFHCTFVHTFCTWTVCNILYNFIFCSVCWAVHTYIILFWMYCVYYVYCMCCVYCTYVLCVLYVLYVRMYCVYCMCCVYCTYVLCVLYVLYVCTVCTVCVVCTVRMYCVYCVYCMYCVYCVQCTYIRMYSIYYIVCSLYIHTYIQYVSNVVSVAPPVPECHLKWCRQMGQEWWFPSPHDRK